MSLRTWERDSESRWLKAPCPLTQTEWRQRLVICDSSGVPEVVQFMQYYYTPFLFEVWYFDGSVVYMEPPDDIGLRDRVLTERQWLIAQLEADKQYYARKITEQAAVAQAQQLIKAVSMTPPQGK